MFSDSVNVVTHVKAFRPTAANDGQIILSNLINNGMVGYSNLRDELLRDHVRPGHSHAECSAQQYTCEGTLHGWRSTTSHQ